MVTCRLDKNLIGDDGTEVLGENLQHCPNIQKLV